MNIIRRPISIIVRAEPCGVSRTGVAYRAYHLDNTPVYCGGETYEELIETLDRFYQVESVTLETVKVERTS